MTALNVRDFGALGDGVSDDTAFIQAALDEAYGTADAPHGGSEGRYANRAVYFPNGWYYFEVMCVAEGGAAWIARSAIGSWTVS
jgi:polygalacturonase